MKCHESHVTRVASLTNGQMTHVHSVVTLNIACVDMSQLMWWADMQVKVWVSHLWPDYITAPLCSPLEQHNQRSHSDLTKIRTTHSLSSATNLLPHMGLTLISVIATYDSISLLRLELVLRTKDLRSHKRCKLRSFYDEISTCTTINSSFAHRQELHNSTWQGSDGSRG